MNWHQALARLAMLADTVASVRQESRIWGRHLIGEGHATVRRHREAASAEVTALAGGASDRLEPSKREISMIRRGFVRRVAALTGFMLAVAAIMPTTSAAEQKLEGSWLTLVTATDPPGLPAMQSLMTFTRTGEVLESRRLYVQTPFGPLLETGGHGAWERGAHDNFLVKFIFLVQAAPNHPVLQNGEPLGTDNIRMRLRLDHPGETFSGTFESEARDPQGNVVFTAHGTVQGTRIRP